MKTRIAELDGNYGAVVMKKKKRVYKKGKSCTGSRVGAACDRVSSFGFISGDQGNYLEVPQVANIMEPEQVAEFNAMYADAILHEFSKFDRRKNTE